MTYKDILYIHAYIAFCYYEKSAMELITIEDAYRMCPQYWSWLVYNYLRFIPHFLILWCYLISPFGERSYNSVVDIYVAFVMTDGREEHA